MNRPAIATVVAFFALAASATPSENTFAAVTNDWYNANFTNVYELAQQRLAANSNDVVGAYLMLDWDISFSEIPVLSNSISRLLYAADAVTNAAFKAKYQSMRPYMVLYRDEFLATLTEEERLAELPKSFIPHKDIIDKVMLKLLWDENLW